MFGVRHKIALLCVMGNIITYAMRTCLSVTIVAMVTRIPSKRMEFGNASNSSSLFDIFPRENENMNNQLDWDDKTKGVVLGSFYYGYVLTYCLGGRLADYKGGRFPFGLSVLLASLLTLLSPFAARQSSLVFIFLKIMHGVVDGLGDGSIYKIITQWFPIQERSKFTSYIYSGYTFGILISMVTSGWLCKIAVFGGWPSVFYLFGSVGLIFSLFWFLFVYDDPFTHPRIKQKELTYISQGFLEGKTAHPVPWRSLLTSKYVWIICVANFGLNWIENIILIDLPTYFDDVLNIEIQNNGLISSVPFLGSSLISIATGYVLNLLFSRQVISLLTLRRISIFISGYITMIGMLILSFLDNKSYTIVTLFVLMESFLGAGVASFYCSSADIAPDFAGTVNGFTYTFGIITGFLSPNLTGLLLQYFDRRFAWRIIFLIGALFGGFATSIYILFITTKIQPWNDPKSKDEKEQVQCQNSIDLNVKDELAQGHCQNSIDLSNEEEL